MSPKIMHPNFRKPKSNFSELEKDKYVIKWLDGVKSKRLRLGHLKRYCDFLDKTPEEIIMEQHEDSILKPIKQKEIGKKQLFSYFYYLVGDNKNNNINDKIIEKKISWNSAKQYVFSKLASFYKRNKVPIIIMKSEAVHDKKNAKTKVWKNGVENDKISNESKKDWLSRIYNQFNSKKNKAILLCKISSGLDDVDLFDLTYKHFKDGYYKDINICYIEGNRRKSKTDYQTCFSSEACDSIKSYFKDRERKGEVLTDESWLFVVDTKFGDDYIQMYRTLFYNQLLEVCKILDLKNITPKSLRRWYDSNGSKKLDVQSNDLFKLTMGHSAKLVKAYQEIANDPESFVKWYKENIESKILILGRSEYIRDVKVNMEEINDTINSQAMKIRQLEVINETIFEKNKKLNDKMDKIEKYDISEMKTQIADLMSKNRELSQITTILDSPAFKEKFLKVFPDAVDPKDGIPIDIDYDRNYEKKQNN